MSRIRSIQPHFPNSYRIQEVSREARYLKAILSLVADDEGRFRLDYEEIGRKLYPGDTDVMLCLPSWLGELERIEVLETYVVDEASYARLVHWEEEQTICHPTPSLLPRSPKERPEHSRISRISRTRRGQRQKVVGDQAHADRSAAILESDFILSGDSPIVVDRNSALRDFSRIQYAAELDGAHTAALRAAEMKAKYAGITPVMPEAATGTEAGGQPATKSPARLEQERTVEAPAQATPDQPENA